MLEILSSTVSRLLNRTGIISEESELSPIQTNLYRCGSCEQVYIAADKETCSTCDGDTEQVPATLTESTDN